MKRVFAAVLAAACVLASTPGFARGGAWAWLRICQSWRLRARSYHSPGITGAADARLPKPDSGPARGTCAAARHQRALGAQPIRGGYVGAQPLTPPSIAYSRAAW